MSRDNSKVRSFSVSFRVPVNQWIRGKVREYLLDQFQGRSSLTRAYCDPRVLGRVQADHLIAGKTGTSCYRYF